MANKVYTDEENNQNAQEKGNNDPHDEGIIIVEYYSPHQVTKHAHKDFNIDIATEKPRRKHYYLKTHGYNSTLNRWRTRKQNKLLSKKHTRKRKERR